MRTLKKQYHLSLFIFRRDLRLDDNTALLKALQDSEVVIPCFIFDPRQIGKENNYRSDNCVQFMIESLQEVDKYLAKHKGNLYTFYGQAENLVEELLQKLPINAVYFNKDYTPFSIERDTTIAKLCKRQDVDCVMCDDLTLVPPENFLNKQKKPYQVFTPFFKTATKALVQQPQKMGKPGFYTQPIKLPSIDLNNELTSKAKILNKKNKHILVHGGHLEGRAILKNIGSFKNYKETHDVPSMPTTHLSAHLKFGTVSVREAFHCIKKELGAHHPLIRQLYWRDFFSYVAYHFPHVFGHAFRKKYDKLSWKSNNDFFKQWCNGTTGFPIIDAGMRQLNTTGFMHNRVRMVVASFLVKDLHIDWQKGERYFAQKLVDYDPAVNNGNWQWCASTGADAQPYFRIFNPWLQQKKFDPDCTYIKTWVPELQKYTAKQIHQIYKIAYADYQKPIVDHQEQIKYTRRVYKLERTLK